MRGAIISECGKFRYSLSRVWYGYSSKAVFIMLNPSTADDVQDDPTIKRCIRRACNYLGCNNLVVVNLFAFRSTDPKGLYEAKDPVGPENDKYIMEAIKDAKIVICGWGKHGTLNGRDREVLDLIRKAGAKPMALKINKDGTPAHPLYIGYDTEPIQLVDSNEV